jgi:hypothetical protein
VHAALSLVLTLFGVAVHFVALEAHFLAAVQVIVYAGAIVVLFLFVIMLLGVDKAEDLSIEPIPIQRPLAAVIGVGIVGLLVAADRPRRDAPRSPRSRVIAVAGRRRRQHPCSSRQPLQRPRLRVRAHVGAADRRRRRHGAAHPQVAQALEDSSDGERDA